MKKDNDSVPERPDAEERTAYLTACSRKEELIDGFMELVGSARETKIAQQMKQAGDKHYFTRVGAAFEKFLIRELINNPEIVISEALADKACAEITASVEASKVVRER